MKVRPVAVSFLASSPAGDFAAYLRASLAVLEECGIGPYTSWELPALGLRGEGSPAEVPDRVPKDIASIDEPLYLDLITGRKITVTFLPVEIGSNPYFQTRIKRDVEAGIATQDVLDFMTQMAEVNRGLIRTAGVVWAKLVPVGAGTICIPHPPLVEHNSHMIVTTEADVVRDYDRPSEFWSSGWDSVEEFGAHRMLLRAMDTVNGPEYLERIVGQQWQLARAAKAGKTGYALPQPHPVEMEVFRSGPSRLELVGYVAAEQTVEYSCALDRDEHIPGWQIYELRHLRRQRELEDGRPVKTVRVVFLEQWAAMQEKRPLLDVGCRVFHYADDGELRELTE